MPQKSAGILLFRRTAIFELLLVHPGGPFWAKRWKGAWQIAKGLVGAGETEEQAARREFEEETGIRIDGSLLALGSIRQKGGKEVVAFAAEGECDPEAVRSNSFEIEGHREAADGKAFRKSMRCAGLTSNRLGHRSSRLRPPLSIGC